MDSVVCIACGCLVARTGRDAHARFHRLLDIHKPNTPWFDGPCPATMIVRGDKGKFVTLHCAEKDEQHSAHKAVLDGLLYRWESPMPLPIDVDPDAFWEQARQHGSNRTAESTDDC